MESFSRTGLFANVIHCAGSMARDESSSTSINTAEQREPVHDRHVARAREMLTNRNQRVIFFDQAVLAEPSWDILLALFICRNPKGLDVKALCEIAGIGPAHAISSLESLIDSGLVQRVPKSFGQKPMSVNLTSEAIGKLQRFFHLVGNRKFEAA